MSADILNSTPVDLIAARMLWRAPWWAQYPVAAKMAILKLPDSLPESVWIDYTKAPPASGGHIPITDKRGWKWKCKDEEGIVLGFADFKLGSDGRKDHTDKKKHWWVLLHTGEVRRVRDYTTGKKNAPFKFTPYWSS